MKHIFKIIVINLKKQVHVYKTNERNYLHIDKSEQ